MKVHTLVYSPVQVEGGDESLPSPSSNRFSSVQFSPLTDGLVGGGHEGRFSRDLLFQSFQWEALVSSSGMGRDVQSLMLSIQHFLDEKRSKLV